MHSPLSHPCHISHITSPAAVTTLIWCEIQILKQLTIKFILASSCFLSLRFIYFIIHYVVIHGM
jgi:hypothetical protein